MGHQPSSRELVSDCDEKTRYVAFVVIAAKFVHFSLWEIDW